MSQHKSELGRRDFLKKATLAGGAAAGVAAVALSNGKSAEAAVQSGSGNAAGYRETEHVSTYYELARL